MVLLLGFEPRRFSTDGSKPSVFASYTTRAKKKGRAKINLTLPFYLKIRFIESDLRPYNSKLLGEYE